MRPFRPLLLAAFFASVAPAFAQNIRATGKINEFYAQSCANCHGKKLEGGQTPGNTKVPSLLDDEWVHGGDDDSIAKSIKMGYPEKEMPPWHATMTDKEIRAMVIYIREQQFAFRRGDTKIDKRPEDLVAKSKLHDFEVHPWVSGLVEPFGLAFLPGPGNKAIAAEKKGYLYQIENGKLAPRPVIGVPLTDTASQAGFFDIVPHPDYAKNGWLYLAFSDLQKRDGQPVSLTRIVRGKIKDKDNAFVEQETIYQSPLELYPKAGGPHFGGRIVFDGKGHLFFTIGDRGTGPNAQNLAVPMGKVHRIHDDGRVPADNPFRKDPKALPTIWSVGHRNPQGLALSANGELYDLEHGPRGGDEVNLVHPGRNYGWPVISYGMDYPGTPIGEGLTAKEGMEQPVKYWTPSIAPCGANFYTGDKFPKWKNNLFVASLVGEQLVRLELNGNKVVAEETLFRDLGRIRHVIGGPDGALYVLLPTRISRISPAP
jgi:glucose/arabinose dehydrogenase